MYSKKLRQEIKQLIKDTDLNCSVEEFSDQSQWTWGDISRYQKLSESFIEKFQDKVDWYLISEKQKLSESFIKKFQDKIDWYLISEIQKLSEPFIEEFQDKVVWFELFNHQELSESFIEKYQDKVNRIGILKYQKLSESFIEKYQDKVNWYYISSYQKLSKEFREKYGIKISKDNWLYTSEADKVKYIKKNTNYEIKKDNSGRYLELYKSVRKDYYSVFNFQYKYEVGKTYESHCDYNLTNINSFGLSSWSKEGALKYYRSGRLLKVKVYVKDIGAITRYKKVRSSKLTVIEEII